MTWLYDTPVKNLQKESARLIFIKPGRSGAMGIKWVSVPVAAPASSESAARRGWS